MSKEATAPAPYDEYAGDLSPLQVEIRSDFESGSRYFKSMVQKSKILSLYKKNQSFEKPSEKKRRRKREVIERERIIKMRDRMIASGEWDRKQKARDQKRKAKMDRLRKEAQDSLS